MNKRLVKEQEQWAKFLEENELDQNLKEYKEKAKERKQEKKD